MTEPVPPKWLLPPGAPEGLARRLNVPSVIAQILYRRGVTEAAELEAFFSSDLSSLHDPFSIPGMQEGVARLLKACRSQERIAVFGDFDVDGVTATLILTKTLRRLGAEVIPYIPHRVQEGHGLNSPAVRKLRDGGTSLLVTVDCGITSSREVAEANSLGMEVVITDHHMLPPDPPRAHAIISTAVETSRYPFEELTGAGIAFKLAQGLCQASGVAWDASLPELAALGTVGDVAPLLGENRILVKEGLQIIHKRPSPGVAELCRAAGIEPRAVDTEAISYILAPRLNASGRLRDSLTSYRLLEATSREEAAPLADELDALNRERQHLTDEALNVARQEVLSQDTLPPLIFAANEEFNPGVNGPVAGKLTDEFYRPAVVVALGEVARGSARSIPEFDIGDALARCADLLRRHGGHPRAAGFVADLENIPQLRRSLVQMAEQRLASLDLSPHIAIDAEISRGGLDGESIRWLHRLEPFGEGNQPPVFLSRGVEVLRAYPIGEGGQHLRLIVQDKGVRWDAVAFRRGGRVPQEGSCVDLVFSLGTDSWQGRQVLALRILDMACSR